MNKTNDGFKMQKGLDLGRALAEAHRCLLCYDAPCSKNCPAETDPATFIRKLRFGNIKGAIRTIKKNNILGGACGALCPTARLCEEGCIAAGLDRPIQIGKIQRFLVEHSRAIGFSTFESPASRKEKIAVVGSGPAGLSCAAELAKEGFKVTVFEQMKEPGGLLRYGIPAYRFSKELLEVELDELKNLGVEFKCSSPIKGKSSVQKLLDRDFSSVFIAIGLWEPISLKGKDAKVNGIYSSTDFLSTFRDRRFAELKKKLKGKVVAVIGGGSVAMDCAESALRASAKDVYVIYRRSYSQMPAEEEEKISAQRSGIHFLLLTQPRDYVTNEGNLKGLRLVRTCLGKIDSSGRRSPVEIKGSEWILDVDVVIEAIGNKPLQGSSECYPNIRVADDGLIVADEKTGKTNMKGVFAGGDIVRGPSLVVHAVEDGKKAAKEIIRDLDRRRI